MRELKRNDCAVLHLGLKRHWYKMIDSGVKMVEFREAKTYWQTRIANWTHKMHEGKTQARAASRRRRQNVSICKTRSDPREVDSTLETSRVLRS